MKKNKTDKHLVRLTKKTEKTQTPRIRNKTERSIKSQADKKEVIGKYHERLYTRTCDNSDDVLQFLEKH